MTDTAAANRQVALAGLARLSLVTNVADTLDRTDPQINRLDPQIAWQAFLDPLVLREELPNFTVQGLVSQALEDLSAAEKIGATIIGPGDPDWPEGFDALPSPPVALYRWGRRLPRLHECVAVVGSRVATPYGLQMAASISEDLVHAGQSVVSGVAYGIDAAAHEAALAASSDPWCTTVAVLPCGIDVAYPPPHRALIARIAAQGAVISEYPPGTVPTRQRFLARNWVTAGLSQATVVVEAAARSGSTATARDAASLHRRVFAVPGPVTSATSAGCHHLIAQRVAELATSAQDVLTCIQKEQ